MCDDEKQYKYLTGQKNTDCCTGLIFKSKNSCSQHASPCIVSADVREKWEKEASEPIDKERQERNKKFIKVRQFRAELYNDVKKDCDFALDKGNTVKRLCKMNIDQNDMFIAKYEGKLQTDTTASPIEKSQWRQQVEDNKDDKRFYSMIHSNADNIVGNATEGLHGCDVMKVAVSLNVDKVDTYDSEVEQLKRHCSKALEDANVLMEQWKDSSKEYECPAISVANAAFVTAKPNTKARKVDVKCKLGYDDASSQNTLRCLKQGKFGEKLFGEITGVASCIGRNCGAPQPFGFTSTVMEDIIYPNAAVYNCLVGFSLDGSANGGKGFSVGCGTGGSFLRSGHQCQPVQCGTALALANGKVTSGLVNMYVYQNTINYQCGEGHTITGEAGGATEFQITCQATGAFTQPQQCKPVRCGPSPVFGSTDLMTLALGDQFYGKKLRYDCWKGNTINQQPGGAKSFDLDCQWTGLFVYGTRNVLPQCAPISAGMTPLIPYGLLTPREMFYGQKSTVVAMPGYSLTGNPNEGISFQLTVSELGKYAGIKQFQPVKCGAPLEITKGKTNFKNPYVVYGDLLKYECENGYSFDSSQNPQATSFTIMCQVDGTLSDIQVGSYTTTPQCVNVDDCAGTPQCGPFGNCVDKLLNYSCNCISGYEERYSEEAQARICGNIDDCGPEACGVGECEDLLNDYKCHCPTGYEQTENGEEKTCTRVICGNAPTITQAMTIPREIAKMVYQSVTTYQCNLGYTLNANADGDKTQTVTCQSNRQFTANRPCAAVQCGSTPDKANARKSRTSATYDQKTKYTCEHGYTTDGTPNGDTDFETTCQENGLYTEIPSCQPVGCGQPPEVANSMRPGGELTFSESVSFGCFEGYTMTGNAGGATSFALQCQHDGKFGGLAQSCTGTDFTRQCMGLQENKGATTWQKCQSDCCASGSCTTWQFDGNSKQCWMGEPSACDGSMVFQYGGMKNACTGTDNTRQCLGLSKNSNAGNWRQCMNDCCASSTCTTWQFDGDTEHSKGCWMGIPSSCDGTLNFASGGLKKAGCPADFPNPSQAHDFKICYKESTQASAGTGPCESWCTLDSSKGSGCGDPKEKMCAQEAASPCQPVRCGEPDDLISVLHATVPDLGDMRFPQVAEVTCKDGFTVGGKADGNSSYAVSCQSNGLFSVYDPRGCQPVQCGKPPEILNSEFNMIAETNAAVEEMCAWAPHPGKYSGGYADGVSSVYDLVGAQKKCLELKDTKCKAVTCDRDGRCTVRASTGLGVSPIGETSYVPEGKCGNEGCRVEIYEHDNYGGWRANYAVGEHPYSNYVGAGAHNDGQTSLKVIGEGCEAHLYQHGGFTGWRAVFPAGDYTRGAMEGRGAHNDDASSVKVFHISKEQNYYREAPNIGGWGGMCTCPDGQQYGVGDHYNSCGSIACEGGVAGQCNRYGSSTWSSKKVTCAPKEQKKEIVLYGLRAEYTCKPGYTAGGEAEGPPTVDVECLGNGQFSEPPDNLKCRNVNDCSQFTCGAHGQCVDLIGPSPAYTCECEQGYEINPQPDGTKICGNIDDCKGITCGPGVCKDLVSDYTCICPAGHYLARLSNGEKTCEPLQCRPAAPAVQNGAMESQHTGPVLYPTTLVYGCNSGYSTDGSASLAKLRFQASCKEHGELMDMMYCQPISCGSPRAFGNMKLTSPSNHNTVITYSNKATYECDNGFSTTAEKNGPKSFNIKCQSNGRLESPKTCSPVRCGTAPNVPKASRSTSGVLSFGGSVTYHCDTGHTTSGAAGGSSSFVRRCLASGSLESSSATCKAVSAGKIPGVNHAAIFHNGASASTNTEAFYPDTVQYRCNSGYTFNGHRSGGTTYNMQVTASGTFSPPRPGACKLITYTVNGLVKDARTGGGLSGVTVDIQGRQASTGSGYFTINSCQGGSVQFKYRKSGYIDVDKTVSLNGDISQGGEADINMSPVMPNDQWRATIKWGPTPRDLDTHVQWASNSLYYGRMHINSGNIEVRLEHDDTNGYGPETVHFSNIGNARGGAYNCDVKYKMYDYSRTQQMPDKQGDVTLYHGDTVVHTWKIANCRGSVTSDKLWWHVFTIDACTNTLKWQCDSSVTGLTSLLATNISAMNATQDKDLDPYESYVGPFPGRFFRHHNKIRRENALKRDNALKRALEKKKSHLRAKAK
jgi:hypothetical protein